MKARLIEDGGAAASDAEQFFRSPVVSRGRGGHPHAGDRGDRPLRLPMIGPADRGERPRRRDLALRLSGRRPVTGGPARSRPGSTGRRPAWSASSSATASARRPCFAAARSATHVQVAEGDAGIRKRLREQIRRNERRGWDPWLVRRARGGDGPAPGLRACLRGDDGPDRRGGALPLSERATSSACWLSDRSWLVLADRDGERPGRRDRGRRATAICTTTSAAPRTRPCEDSPMKNLFAAMIGLGRGPRPPGQPRRRCHPGDSLDDFKRGFADGREPRGITHEVICDAGHLRGAARGRRRALRRGSSPPIAPSRRRRRAACSAAASPRGSGSAARGRCRDRCRGSCGSRRGPVSL